MNLIKSDLTGTPMSYTGVSLQGLYFHSLSRGVPVPLRGLLGEEEHRQLDTELDGGQQCLMMICSLRCALSYILSHVLA